MTWGEQGRTVILDEEESGFYDSNSGQKLLFCPASQQLAYPAFLGNKVRSY